MKFNEKLTSIVQKCTADHGMERVPFHDREMEISIQYHVTLIRQLKDQGPVVRKVDSAIHRIVIFSTVAKMLEKL